MHSWGDEDFTYWKELENAAEYIGNFCRRLGRIQVRQYKEKWGTVRVYCTLSCDNLHELIWPGYCWIHTPYSVNTGNSSISLKKYQQIINSVAYDFWTFRVFRPLRFLIRPYQRFIYRLAYKNAIKKWPMIKEEILCCADWSEYLEDL